jgi:pyruvate dehydrogenase E1 component beta subunit
VYPATPADAKGLLKSAIRSNNPVLFVESQRLYPSKGVVSDDPDLLVPIGSARVARPGRDATIVGWGPAIIDAIDAAETLASEHGIDTEVIDLRSLVPLDMDTVLASVRKTGRAIIVHEAHYSFGWGAEVAARLTDACFYDLIAPPQRVTSKDAPFPFNRTLEAFVMPSVADIVAAGRRLMKDY